MGSYAYLRIGDLKLYSTKNDFDPSVMMLFSEQDKRILPYLPTESDIDSDPDLDYAPKAIVQYAINLSVAQDRLEFMGFTLSQAKHYFQEGLEQQLAQLTERRGNPSWEHEAMRAILAREEVILKALSFDAWLESFSFIVSNKLKSDSHLWYEDKPSELPLTPLVRYMLGDSSEGFFGFPALDFRAFMRAAVEIIGTNAELVYDVTDLVEGGYFGADEDLCSYARRDMVEDFAVNHKIVVLTEGKSDKSVLEGSMKLLYPHLIDYYSFMDFEGARAPGGAPALVATVKAFIGAGIVNRIVAFFDNDTAARSAMRTLDGLKIPKSVRIMRYPNIPVACNYPTLGPQGTVNMNVNGLAGSIELYFGDDILRSRDGTLTPVQWRGFDEALRQYQGEILNKGDLQARFATKLADCLANRHQIEDCDWSGIRAILDLLRTAFHEK